MLDDKSRNGHATTPRPQVMKREPLASDAEGDLASEADAIGEQARRARLKPGRICSKRRLERQTASEREPDA